MAAGRSTFLLLAIISSTSAASISYDSQGRKLFGGYRIVPRVCQPSNPSRANKPDEPAICMFNYECQRRNGEVVGACMDGFLFGACCQLPSKHGLNKNSQSTESPVNLEDIDHVPEVPILLNPDGTPVGFTVADRFATSSSTSSNSNVKTPQKNKPSSDYTQNAEKSQLQPDISQLESKFPALLGQQHELDSLGLPGLITHTESNNDIQDHQGNNNYNPVMTMLSPNQILQIADPVDQLPALFATGGGYKNYSAADTVLLNENGTQLAEANDNPDDFFRPIQEASSSDNTPSFSASSQWIEIPSQRPTSLSSSRLPSTNNKFSGGGESSVVTPAGITTEYKVASTPAMQPEEEDNSGGGDDDFVKVQTLTYEGPSGNKKHDEADKEEMAINHILSILNNTTPSSSTKVTFIGTSPDQTAKPTIQHSTTFPYTYFKPASGNPSSASASIYSYDAAAPSTQSVTSTLNFKQQNATTTPQQFPAKSSVQVTQSSQQQSGSTYPYSTKQSTNPPAPTVIVLGPLGTEYTTVPTQKTPTRRPGGGGQQQSTILVAGTKKPNPNLSTTITHNISTIISGTNVVTNNLVSSSHFSVDIKDGTTARPNIFNNGVTLADATSRIPTKRPSTIRTTLSPWSAKPSFHLRPSTSTNIKVPSTNLITLDSFTEKSTTAIPKRRVTTTPTTPTPPCKAELMPPDESSNFPPVRNPNLNLTMIGQQNRPTIVETFSMTPGIITNEDDVPTPAFVEDDVLTNKVDVFVQKIVESLNGNFQDLKDVVYTKKNVTDVIQTSTISAVSKKPPTTVLSGPTRRPTRKPTQKVQTTTKKTPTKRPTNRPEQAQKPPRPAKPTTNKIKPVTQTTPTKKPSRPTKRPPQRIPTTTLASFGETTFDNTENLLSAEATESNVPTTPEELDYRTHCGIRPHMKSGRIVGGKGAKFGEWPWQVLIRETTWLGYSTKNKCGGVLITNKHVITAAHCQPSGFSSFLWPTLVVVLGEYDITGELEPKRSVTRNVKRTILNRGYNPATFENDLAVLEMESPVQFDTHIVPICMPEDNADFTGRMATVTGWGRLKYNGGIPSILQEVRVPILENSVCQEMFQTANHQKLILESFLCAGYANGNKDSCEGDSGGPLVLQRPDGRWTLVGTVSHGIKCAAPYLPGVYMRTTFFKPWLHQLTGV